MRPNDAAAADGQAAVSSATHALHSRTRLLKLSAGLARLPCTSAMDACYVGAIRLMRLVTKQLAIGVTHAVRVGDALGVLPRGNVAARRVKCRQTQGVPPPDAVPSRMEAIVGKIIEITR